MLLALRCSEVANDLSSLTEGTQELVSAEK